MTRRSLLPLLSAPWLQAQEPVDFICPMDPEVHSKQFGKCPRCGMWLEANLPEAVEYRLQVDVLPKAPKTTQTTSLRFKVIDPRTNRPVARFNTIHEKLFHLFLISEDLEFFAHEHPEPLPGGEFLFHAKLPKPGFYRMLADFYPAGGTPQLIAAPLFVSGPAQPFDAPQTPNLKILLRTDPVQPLAFQKTMLFFQLTPFEGVEPWLGAWGHLLSASSDLVELVHSHPVWEPYETQVQFNRIFPGPGKFRLWAQFQRNGIVNTGQFDILVKPLG